MLYYFEYDENQEICFMVNAKSNQSKVGLNQDLNLDPMGTSRLSCLRP
jgi:hypothetical protein